MLLPDGPQDPTSMQARDLAFACQNTIVKMLTMLALTAPIRGVVLRTCQMVYYKLDRDPVSGAPQAVPAMGHTPKCPSKECADPACEGNVMYIPSVDTKGPIILTWNHHKNSYMGGSSGPGAPFNTIIQDPRAITVLQYWYLHGRSVLYYGTHGATPDNTTFLLMHYDSIKGGPIPHTSMKFAIWVRSKCNTHPTLKPSIGRHVWSSLLGNMKTGTPLHTKLAAILEEVFGPQWLPSFNNVMAKHGGNSLDMWDNYYNLVSRERRDMAVCHIGKVSPCVGPLCTLDHANNIQL
jgi:hypothetical protein